VRVDAQRIEFLIRTRWLDPAHADDRRAIAGAIERMLAAPPGDPSRSA
jgi:hypothetical protein